jgi:hypothetical protein
VKASDIFFEKTGRRLEDLGPLDDAERVERAATGKVPKRQRFCANRPPDGDCRRWAEDHSMFCGEDCRTAWRTRVDSKWVGGSLVREIETTDKQIGATRFPRENSRKGDGCE